MNKNWRYGPLHLVFLVLFAVGAGLMAGCEPNDGAKPACTTNAQGTTECDTQTGVQDPADAPAAQIPAPPVDQGVNKPKQVVPLRAASEEDPNDPSPGYGQAGGGAGGGGASGPGLLCWDGSRRDLIAGCPPSPAPTEDPS